MEQEKPNPKKTAYIQHVGEDWHCYDCNKRYGAASESVAKGLSVSLQDAVDSQGIYNCGAKQKCPYDLVQKAIQEVELRKFMDKLL